MPPAPEQLKRWRKLARLTQAEAAKRIGLDQSQVSKYEAGHDTPGLLIASRIQSATGIPATSWVS